MTARCWRYGAATLLAYVLFSPSDANAGAVLITHGDTISHVGEAGAENGRTLKVGYKWSYWGIFWLDLWTWGGTYCVYEDKRYQPIEPAHAAVLMGKKESDLGRPFLYSVPLGWLIVVPLVVIGFIAGALEKRKPNQLTQLFQDPRYQKAIQIMNEEYDRQGAEAPASPDQGAEQQANTGNEGRFRVAFDAGVQHLVDQGIPRPEGEQNLAIMVQALANVPQQEQGETSPNEDREVKDK
jgi:hypothetical protein